MLLTPPWFLPPQNRGSRETLLTKHPQRKGEHMEVQEIEKRATELHILCLFVSGYAQSDFQIGRD